MIACTRESMHRGHDGTACLTAPVVFWRRAVPAAGAVWAPFGPFWQRRQPFLGRHLAGERDPDPDTGARRRHGATGPRAREARGRLAARARGRALGAQ